MKIGILGGSFNPIHTGHAIVANYLAQNCGLDRLWLMVAKQNPLKPHGDPSLDQHRLRMAQIVARTLHNVEASGFELSMPYPSYTIDTLDTLAANYPQHQFVIAIGADNWTIFDKWKEHNRIIDQYGVIVYPRLGYPISIDPSLAGRVTAANAPIIEVSSTTVRKLIAQGKDVGYLVPMTVLDYIKANKLYEQRQ